MLLYILRRILLIHAVVVTFTIITVKVGVFTVTHQPTTTDSLSASSLTDSLFVNVPLPNAQHKPINLRSGAAKLVHFVKN